MLDFKYEITERDEKDKTPLSDIIRREFRFSARMRKRVKRENLTLLNGKPAPGWISAKKGDVITISVPGEDTNFPPEDIPLDVVFEDDHLLIINKQPGIIVHPTNGNPSGTIANAAAAYYNSTDQSHKIRFVNRLDMDTSGLLVIAKNGYAQSRLMAQMKSGGVQKDYIAVVEGITEKDGGIINEPIGLPPEGGIHRRVLSVEDGGAPSLTRFQTIERFHLPSEENTPDTEGIDLKANGNVGRTLVRLSLETGRTHQIRVHMAHIGHPVLTDPLYGHMFPDEIKRQALHAAFLAFTHPITGLYTEVRAPLPEDMKRLLAILKGES